MKLYWQSIVSLRKPLFPAVSRRFYSWCCTFYSFGQMDKVHKCMFFKVCLLYQSSIILKTSLWSRFNFYLQWNTQTHEVTYPPWWIERLRTRLHVTTVRGLSMPISYYQTLLNTVKGSGESASVSHQTWKCLARCQFWDSGQEVLLTTDCTESAISELLSWGGKLNKM